MNFKKFLNEELENFYLTNGNEKAKRAVVFTARAAGKEHTNTVQQFEKYFKKHDIKFYVAYNEDAYIVKGKDDILRVYNVEDNKGFEIYSKDTLILNRASVAKQTSMMDLITKLEKSHFFCCNSRECIEICGDKFRTGLRLMDLGLPTPKTSSVRSEKNLERAHKEVGGKFPVVLKTIYGTKGKGVFIAESWKNMLSVLQTIWHLNPETEIIIQEFIKSDGDMRIHVLGDKVIAAMRRIHGAKEFRANYSLGGSIENIDLDTLEPEVIDLAIKASKAVGGVWTGVDIITSQKDGTSYILEVNSSPGTEGIEEATKIPVTKICLDFLVQKKNWKIPTVTCGFIENIWIDDIGFVKAKFDTGNGSLCSIHADSYEIKDDQVIWKHNNKTYKNKLVEIKTVKVGGLKSYSEDRPVVKLNITFNGETFENYPFCLTNRINNNKQNKSAVLINREFMRIAGLNIDPNKTYLLSLKNPEIESKENA